MRTVNIFAGNVKIGDIFEGKRVLATHDIKARKGYQILLVMKHRDGYKFDTFQTPTNTKIKVKRPSKNKT